MLEQRRFDPSEAFRNEPDTDWSLAQNREWIRVYVDRWKNADLPQPQALAKSDEVERALQKAVVARADWSMTSIAHRRALLCRVAEVLAERRGELLGVMMRDAAKSVAEGDAEVSEAIDFANYYARAFDAMKVESIEPLGSVLVTPPWNFPLAIPAGGVFAALMAGNTVILKPAPETVLTAWHLANAIWDAGVPRDAMQFLPTTDDEVGQALVTDARISAVILTGSYETARLFKSWKPELRLIAETSGKNSIIVSALSDRDQAIKDILRSAFGHAGQKCSAASLAVLEAEVYDSVAFRNRLRDAAASLPVGESWDMASSVTPLIREPGKALARALTQLDAGEEWLLAPRMVNGNPRLWSPGIKLGVRRGSWFHRTECFGPVLGLMRAKDFQEAIEIVNDSEFGLTSGLHSLDEREIAIWRDRIQAGNLYINRGTTGAIVQRQPFGGWKKSVFGSAKAGGPNYVLGLCRCTYRSDASPNYEQAWRDYFSREHDPSQILGESNVFRYRPIRNVLIVGDGPDVELAMHAAGVCGVPATVCQSDEAVGKISSFERVRALAPLPRAAYAEAVQSHTLIVDEPISRNGRLELRHYLREQSVTFTHHRYGSIVGAV